ncbi:MAG: hypothetical protein ACJA0N_002122 [Pseudohongiellaceae bacterium]|jgi:hypothetical protein
MDYMHAEIARTKGVTQLQVVTNQSDIVFIGEAMMSIETIAKIKNRDDQLMDVETSFVVKENIKGVANKKVMVSSKGRCTCRYSFQPGTTYLVFANSDEGTYKTYSCKFIQPTDNNPLVGKLHELTKVNKTR